ncbi:MAG: RNA-binding protein [Spirochaetales bacterium]|nr:RNA-binding protein [Spirochaetales bacterium]
MSPKNTPDLDLSAFQASLEDLIKKIKEEDPSELDAYRKVFRRTVPFFLRSYIAAYLFRNQSHRSFPRRRPAQVVTLFVSIGKNRRVFPRDLILFLVNGAGIGKADLGDIKILDSYSFVEVQEDVASQVIEKLNGTTYRGKRIVINFAKKRGNEGTYDVPDSAEDGQPLSL